MKSSEAIINERRQKVWTCLTKGMKRHEIARALNTDRSTVSRDMKYLAGQSQDYLNDLAKETLPFMYQCSIEGIRDIIKECWSIYESRERSYNTILYKNQNQSQSQSINMYHKLAALRLIKDCHESIFQLLDEGPSVLAMRQLQDRLILIENRQAN